MSETRILVINPNSNASVTAGMDAALDESRSAHALEIDCVTLADGPFGIESDEDVAKVVPLVVREITERNGDYAAFVVACYSDPGVNEARTLSVKPVLGIQESAIGLSASYGRRFGVVALSRESIQRHIAFVRSIGLQDFHAGERPLDISVDDAANDPETVGRIIEVGRELVEEDGAETVILGCAGLAAHRRAVQSALGLPVIDPVLAAVTLAKDVITKRPAAESSG